MSVHAVYLQVRYELSQAAEQGAGGAAVAQAVTAIAQGGQAVGFSGRTLDALQRLAWLLFVRAPEIDGRYVALAPMNVMYVAAGQRTPAELVDELIKLELSQPGDAAPLDSLLAQHGEALAQRVASEVGRRGGSQDRIAAAAQRADAAAQSAVAEGRWDEVPIEGPDAPAIRAALRFLPAGRAETVYAAWQDAATAAEAERWSDAIAKADVAIAAAPDLFESYIRRARFRFGVGDRLGAGADVERALSLNGQATTARAMRGELRLLIRDLVGSLQDWDTAVAGAPGHMPFRLGRGYTRIAAGKVDEAIADFSAAIELAPEDPTPRYSRAEAKIRKKDHAGAVADYDVLVERDAGDLQARLNRGTVHLMSRQGAAAIADFDVVVDKRPTDPLGWARRAAAQLQAERPWPAWVDALTALAVAPDEWPHEDQTTSLLRAAYQGLGAGEHRKPDAQDVAPRFELLRQKASNRELLRFTEMLGQNLPAEGLLWHLLRGEAWLSLQKWDDARKAYEDAIAVDDQRAAAWLGLGRAFLGGGDAPRAMPCLDRATALVWDLDEAGTFELHLARARAQGSVGLLPASIQSFDDALALRPERADVWFYKGVHLGLLGDGKSAVDAYAQSVTHNGAFAPAWFNRACELARLGEKEEALADLGHAVQLDRRWADEAKGEAYFQPYWQDPAFLATVG